MTTSKILRRSGKAVTEYCHLIEFIPNLVCIVGLGLHHGEVFEMRDAWDDFDLYGFEPHPETYKSIVDDFPGRLYPYAVSDKDGFQNLYSKPKHKDGASLFQKKIEKDKLECEEFGVDVTTLDFMFKAMDVSCINRNGLLWIDCEGNESCVLLGGKKFIDKCISVVNVEMTGKPRSEGWSKPVDVHKKLVEYGFLQSWIHTNRSCIFQQDSIYLRKEIFHPEACACPESILMYEEWKQIE